MEMEMLEARPIDVLLALIRVEEAIQVWKAAVVDRVREEVGTMHIAQGPFRGWGPPIPDPDPPYTGCWPDHRFMEVRPLSGDLTFDINPYTQQLSGFLLGLHYGLEHDQRSPTDKTS